MKFLNDMKKQLEKTINYIDLNPTDKSNELEDELKADKLIMIENKTSKEKNILFSLESIVFLPMILNLLLFF